MTTLLLTNIKKFIRQLEMRQWKALEQLIYNVSRCSALMLNSCLFGSATRSLTYIQHTSKYGRGLYTNIWANPWHKHYICNSINSNQMKWKISEFNKKKCEFQIIGHVLQTWKFVSPNLSKKNACIFWTLTFKLWWFHIFSPKNTYSASKNTYSNEIESLPQQFI